MSGNSSYIAPNGESLFQRTEIELLKRGMTGIEATLNAKVDNTKYQGKINLLEANDLRHDADIAYLEANKLDKTVFDNTIYPLLAKDAIHDGRLNTLDALKNTKVNISDYQSAIAGLTGVDAAFDHRLDVLEGRYTELDADISQEVQNIVQNYVLNTTYDAAVQQLQNTDSALAAAILTKADQAIATQIQTGLTNLGNDKVSKTEFTTDKAALGQQNLIWERRLMAVDQYIKAMIETYEIKKPGGEVYDYTAALKNWEMKDEHFNIVGRNPGGDVVLELPEFSYNSFYGSIKMFFNNSSTVAASTKSKMNVSVSAPRRLTMDPGFTNSVQLSSAHFPITITMYDSGNGVIKTKTITQADYDKLHYIQGAAFTYAKTSFDLVKGSSVAGNTLDVSPVAYAGGDLNNAAWSIVNLQALPSGLNFDTANGRISGSPNSNAVVGSSTVTVRSEKNGNPNSLVLAFNVVAPHTIAYTPNAQYTRNVDIVPDLPVVMTNNAVPNNVFSFAVSNPDNDLTTAEVNAGMFTKGVYITKVNDAVSGRVAGAIWGNPKNVGTRTYTVVATGLNGATATTDVELNIVNVAPAFNYNHVIATVGATWTDYTHTVRLNDVFEYLPNIASTSGEIAGASYPVASGGPKPNYEISPALPANSNLVFDANTGKIYTATVAPVNGVQQPQGVLAQFNATTFTITAYGPGGSGTATFKLQCLGPIPSFAYNPLAMDFVKGVAGTSFAPINVVGVNATGAFTLYNLAGSASATLPATLSFNADTGVVSGTPNAVVATTGYSVRAVGVNGTSLSMPFYLTVKDAIPAFDYASAVNVFTRGSVGTAFAPTVASGSGAINFYALFNNASTPAPAVLPPGLNFNNSTGQVTGTPIESNHGVAVTYNVKAYGPGGESVFKTFQLQINETAPVIAYAPGAKVFEVDKLITPIAPTTKLNDINSWYISGATPLPAGLSINSTTGVITGIPTARNSAGVNVNIYATGDGGFSNYVSLNMKVDFQAPVFSYASGVKTIMAGENITPIAPAVSVANNQGAGTLTWTSSPVLPGSLTFGQDGAISGSTTVLGGPVEYTITATNTDGKSASTKIFINVDTNVSGASDLTVLNGDDAYDAKHLVSTTSNLDVVFIKKVSAGNLVGAALVYENASGSLEQIGANKTLVSGDFVAFQLDRTVQKPQNQTQKLYVFSAFSQTSVLADAVAQIQYEPADVFAAPVISGLNATYSFQKDVAITAIDANATGELNTNPWSATGLSAIGLAIDQATGVISGIPTAVAGDYNVTVSVSGKGGVDSEAIVITITAPAPPPASAVPTVPDVTIHGGFESRYDVGHPNRIWLALSTATSAADQTFLETFKYENNTWGYIFGATIQGFSDSAPFVANKRIQLYPGSEHSIELSNVASSITKYRIDFYSSNTKTTSYGSYEFTTASVFPEFVPSA
jgi:hypothetical protein